MPQSMTLEAAQVRILDALQPVAILERVGLRAALGRVLGEDVVVQRPTDATTDTLLMAGHRLSPADLGWLARAGRFDLGVCRRLRVALFSVADGLRSLGESLGTGDAYDSNRYTLQGMLTQCGVDALDLGVVPNAPAALRAVLDRAGAEADVVIAAGGVGVRSSTPMRAVLERCGAIEVLDIRVRPCRPLPFGRLHGGAVFFGLSSNPLPTAVMYHQLVQPALARLAGAVPRSPLTVIAQARATLNGVRGYRNFRRGRLELDAAGALTVDAAAPPAAGVQHLMRDADCFIVLPEDGGPFAPGTCVAVQPFAGFAEAAPDGRRG